VHEQTDTNLVNQAQGGDVNAVGELYDRHHAAIFRYVRSRVRNQRQAEDLTGEVFVRMLAGLPNYRPTQVTFRAWLYRVAHNLVVDHYRQENNHTLVALDHAEGMSEGKNNPDSIIEHHLTVQEVQHALETIDPVQREVVILRFLVGMPLKEVALTLDKTVAAVKSLQHRGLADLRLALAQG